MDERGEKEEERVKDPDFIRIHQLTNLSLLPFLVRDKERRWMPQRKKQVRLLLDDNNNSGKKYKNLNSMRKKAAKKISFSSCLVTF